MESPSAVFGEQELRKSFQGGSDTFSSNAYPSPTSGAHGALEGLARVHPGVSGSQVFTVLLDKSQLDVVMLIKYRMLAENCNMGGDQLFLH